MDVGQQIKGLRDTAFQLALTSEGVWHAESGVRGQAVQNCLPMEAAGASADGEPPTTSSDAGKYAFVRPLHERAYRAFMRRYLCGEGSTTQAVHAPLQTYGFSFSAASVGSKTATAKQERDISGVGHSFIYGDRGSIERLARLVAAPAMRYLAAVSDGSWIRQNALDDPEEALGDWVYLIYEVGLQTGDANLRRFYRLLMPLDGSAVGLTGSPLWGFDGRCICREDVSQKRVAEMIWSAAGRQEIGFARLGTELTLASRIALDHLLNTDSLKLVGDRFYGKLLEAAHYDWARISELEKAAQHCLGEAAPNKGVISRAADVGEIDSNGQSGKARLVHVGSFLVWATGRNDLSSYERKDLRNAIIGEISSRKRRRN